MSSSRFSDDESPRKQRPSESVLALLRLTPEEHEQESRFKAMHELAAQLNAGQPSLPPGHLPDYMQGAVRLSQVEAWAGTGRIGAVKRALLDGADVNEPDEHGVTPLHYAARQGDQSIVKLLLQCGANAMAKTPSGERPVDLAKAKTTNDLIELMLTYGADPQAVRDLLNSLPIDDETQWRQYTVLAQSAYEQANYTDAEQLLVAALRESERFGPFDGRLGKTLRDLGNLYLHLGRHAEAMPLFSRLASIQDQAGSPSDDEIVEDAMALCECAFRLGMYDKVGGYGYTVLFMGGLCDTPKRTANLPLYERTLDLMKRSVEMSTDLGHMSSTIEEFTAIIEEAKSWNV